MQLIKISIDQLKPAVYNPRIESSKLDKAIIESIKTFGYVDPIIVNADYTIIRGHQRYRVLKNMGYTDLEVIQIDLDKSAEKALNIALNKITGDWDQDKLKGALLDLESNLLGATGFSESELRKYFRADPVTEIVPIKNIESENITIEPNSMYICDGKHFIMNGDCTNKEDVNTLLTDSIDMLLTDPPYGVDYGSKVDDYKKIGKFSRNDGAIDGDINLNIDFFKSFLSLAFTHMAVKNTCYIFMLGGNLYTLDGAFMQCGGTWGDYLIWNKGSSVMNRKDYNAEHEFIYYGWYKAHKFYGPPNASSMMKYPKPVKNKWHPHQKPLDILSHLIQDGSAPGGRIYDPFGGSGSTLIAAAKLGRVCYTMEKDVKRFGDMLARLTLEGIQYERIR